MANTIRFDPPNASLMIRTTSLLCERSMGTHPSAFIIHPNGPRVRLALPIQRSFTR